MSGDSEAGENRQSPADPRLEQLPDVRHMILFDRATIPRILERISRPPGESTIERRGRCKPGQVKVNLRIAVLGA